MTIMMKVTLSRAAEGINIFDFLMSSSSQNSQKILFSPDDGKKYRRSFEQKYGPKGRHLIESMGYNKSYTIPEVTTITTSTSTSTSRATTTALPVKNYTKVIKKKRRIYPTTTVSTKS